MKIVMFFLLVIIPFSASFAQVRSVETNVRPDGTREIKTIFMDGRVQSSVDRVNPPGPHDIIHTEVSLSNGVRTEFTQRADHTVETKNINDSHTREGNGGDRDRGGIGAGDRGGNKEPHEAHQAHEGHP